MLKSPRTNILADVDKDAQRRTKVHKDEDSDHYRKRSNAPSEVKPLENISKNLQSLLEMLCKSKSFLHINCKTMYLSSRILSD